ncbi:DNA polymerase iota-like [Lingula anatina]|uniref:DNA polymerase iota-like n=1 Tax=Lingula anatina TaxID=7574 RepID=A0A1S3K4X5_LINAN|nr:DNA polymerase iota-like [Lingula anatina]|eukprot:XP_013417693.1 DNA polymerase iota-like [Lingula anatina]
MSDDESEDWSLPVEGEAGSGGGNTAFSCSSSKPSCSGSLSICPDNHARTIIHIDIDCFYAQVEMLRNPELRTKPLGIQQKNIVVTCNYVARERGISKLSYVKDAEKKCPDIVLVNGEDLTHYREMSYKITNFLLKYTPKVERLGFDENFLDVSDMVRMRLNDPNIKEEVEGHIYGQGQKDSADSCTCGCHARLTVGTQIAADIRSALQEELGISCCAGIASNKLLSKLVAGTHKPNQQTVLFPEHTFELMLSLEAVRAIPGIGHSTAKRLASLGIQTISQLQEVDQSVLTGEFGNSMAQTMKLLSCGNDQSPVVTTGQAQSISDEDSFRKCQDVEDVKNRIGGLLDNLLKRLEEDGRLPGIIRLTLRKLDKEGQWSKRESRQCRVPSHVFALDNSERKKDRLLQIAMELFHKIIDTKKPFHLTLLNLGFTKFDATPTYASTINAYFSTSAAHTSSTGTIANLKERQKQTFDERSQQPHNPPLSRSFHSPPGKESKMCSKSNTGSSILRWTERKEKRTEMPSRHHDVDTKRLKLDVPGTEVSFPDHIDRSVFDALPPELKQEVLANADLLKAQILDSSLKASVHNATDTTQYCDSSNGKAGNMLPGTKTEVESASTDTCREKDLTVGAENEDNNTLHFNSGTFDTTDKTFNIMVPPDIDKSVFTQLPPDIQKDLLTQWNQKISTNSHVKQKSKTTKSPSLLKYFKKL